ncbi:MAG: FAD:protein FMN transferase [Oscillospiraceae bacterium]|nr:FAD:protein FMN transferase [Oscillospiraceae bacterium]
MYDIYTQYDGLNNIHTINKNAGVAPVKVDKEIIDLLEFSKEWYEKSQGNMNIALGSVLKVWHDVREEYEIFGTAELPDIEYLKEKAQHTDINCIEIDKENMTVFITDENVRLDVGAVAKGYATELIADELVAMGCESFAISAGGNVKTYGAPKDNRERWGIGVQNPAVDENYQMIGGNMDTAFFNTEMSLVCSGGYQRYMVIDGRRYHHLIDPDTLYPEEVYQGVAILCEDSGVADALSTTVFLMEPAQAVEYINGIEGAECILVEIDGTTHITEGAKAYLASCGVTNQTK